MIKRIKNACIILLGGEIKTPNPESDHVLAGSNHRLTDSNNSMLDEEFHEKYLYDFKKGYQSGRLMIGASMMDGDYLDGSNPQKIAIKPVEVLKELERIPTPWSLNNIDDKIEILRHKADLLTQKYAKREVKCLIERLENRKQFHKQASFFNQFQNTNDEKIKALLDKYDLKMDTSELFIPAFPDDAIKTMVDYTKAVADICDKKPIFYVIAEPKDFKKNDERLDPILLVQSPFGFYWQILGAWDKEMLLLSEM